MSEIKVAVLDETSFEELISGRTVKIDDLEIALADIGYKRMIEMLYAKINAPKVATDNVVKNFPEDPQDKLVCDSCQ